MEQKAIASISCALHPSELIQRVALDADAEQQLYCFECILQQPNNMPSPSNLKTIKDFVDMAAAHYVQNKRVITPGADIPPEYQTLLQEQSHNLEELSAHLEEEKKKVEETFNRITEETLSLINQKKVEYLYSLDQQLFNLRYWYIFFDKQVKKAHPTEEDIPFLFPSKEELINRVQKISNATQLMAFVRNIKEDLNDKKSGDARRGGKESLHGLYTQLEEIRNERPQFEDERLEVSSFRDNINKFLSDQLKNMFVMTHYIIDVKQKDFPESKVITSADFGTLKSWVPQDCGKFNPKLIYRGTRDGLDAKSFHNHCDGKGATITVAKVQLANSSEIHTVGGFIDQSWHQNKNIPIISAKAFIFSLTSKLKCEVLNNGAEAAYGRLNFGPVFGGGYDLGFTKLGKANNYSAPCSYLNSEKLFSSKNKNDNGDDEGSTYFSVLELEVYTLN